MELTIDQAFQKSIAAHKRGNLEEAEKLYTAILKVQPKHPDANHNMGILAARLHRVQEALTFFKVALDINPKIEQYWLSYIETLIKLGKLDIARSQLEQSKVVGLRSKKLEQIKNNMNMYKGADNSQIKYLISLFERNELENALDLCNALERSYAPTPIILIIHGNVFAKLDRHIEAILYFHKVVLVAPQYADAYNNMANSLSAIDDLSKAMTALRRAITLNPIYSAAVDNLGKLLRRLNKFKEAASNHQKAALISPNMPRTYKSLGDIEHISRSFAKSLDNYKKSNYIDKSDPVVIHMVNALQNQSAETAPEAYVRHLFDGYAANFDNHLVGKLEYKIPTILKDLYTSQTIVKPKSLKILDLGCGTGLAGNKFKDVGKYLTGIDISPAMVEKAQEKFLYDELIVGGLTDELAKFQISNRKFDLFLCADVLIYVGDCKRLFSQIRGISEKNAQFLFSTELLSSHGFRLLNSGRFAHSHEYISMCIEEFNFRLISYNKFPLRKEETGTLLAGVYHLCTQPL